jgi:hypothetical protein
VLAAGSSEKVPKQLKTKEYDIEVEHFPVNFATTDNASQTVDSLAETALLSEKTE